MSDETTSESDAEVLTDEEMTRVAAFISSLQDRGIISLLTLELCDDNDCDDRTVVGALQEMLEDLDKSCGVKGYFVANPGGIVDAAPSFRAICELAGYVDEVFPDGFIPDANLRKKCLRIFFERVRKDAVTPSADAAS